MKGITRREVPGAMGIAADDGGLSLAAEAVGAGQPEPIWLGKPAMDTARGRTAKSLTHSFSLSDDRRALSLLFDSLEFELSEKDKELLQTTAAAWHIQQQFKDEPGPVVYAAMLRGVIGKTAKSQAVICVSVGQASRVLEFPFGRDTTEDIELELTWSLPYFEERHEPSEGETVIARKPLLLPCFGVSISVVLQRASCDESIDVTIDSFDMEVFART